MFKKIVVGVDGREGGRDALSLGARLALAAGGELVAVQVVALDQFVVRAGAPKYNTMAREEARRRLEQEVADAGLTADLRVLGDTSPARALHGVAEEVAADVIVVGSTRHAGLGRVLAGDDVVGTLHASPCAVAVAPRGLADAEWGPITRIGVGFDATPEAEQALAAAVAVALDSGATLEVMSVVASPVDAADRSLYDSDWLDRARAAAQEHVDAGIADLPVEASGQVAVGEPLAELVELSATVDLLVVGSRAWGPVRRTLVGSTAAKLSRAAHAPLLVLPRGAATGQPGEREPATAPATA